MGEKGFYPWIKSIFSRKNRQRGAEGVYAGPEMINRNVVQDVYAGPEYFGGDPGTPGEQPDIIKEDDAPVAPEGEEAGNRGDIQEHETENMQNADMQMPSPSSFAMMVYAGPEFFRNDSMPVYAGPEYFNGPDHQGPGAYFPFEQNDSTADPAAENSAEVPEGHTACPLCGFNINNDFSFCPECGSPNPGYSKKTEK